MSGRARGWGRAVEGGEDRPGRVARGCCGTSAPGRIAHPIGEVNFTLSPHPLHQARTRCTLRTLLSRTLTFFYLFAKAARNLCRYSSMTATSQLPSRIANKLASITDKATLNTIRDNRLARKNGSFALHIRRHHIFLACIDRRVQLFSDRRAAFRVEMGL